jgi:hypothetical protein
LTLFCREIGQVYDRSSPIISDNSAPPKRLPSFNESATNSQMARLIWDKLRRSPTKAVSDQLSIERWQLRASIHKIKAANNLGATDRVLIYDDGSVTDEEGEPLGNIHDEIS